MSQNLELNDCLIRSILDLIIFLEFSGEDTVDPDAAVGVLEQLSAQLLRMDENDKNLFVEKISALSSEYAGEKAEFIKSIGEDFGLV